MIEFFTGAVIILAGLIAVVAAIAFLMWAHETGLLEMLFSVSFVAIIIGGGIIAAHRVGTWVLG